MDIQKGLSRTVLVFPEWGFVLKFPQVHLWIALSTFAEFLRERDWKAIREFWTVPLEGDFAFKGWLFKGLVTNWMEFWVCVTTRNPFLQPTYFSFFGLMNVQRYGAPCELDVRDLWSQLSELTDGKARQDGHHFSNPKNFTLDGRVLRILDYGSSRTRKVALPYGEKIARQFDPTYERKLRP